jgi:cell division protein FtsW
MADTRQHRFDQMQNRFSASDRNIEEQSVRTTQIMNSAKNLMLVTILLVVFGLTMLYSASYGEAGLKYFRNQIIWVFLGICGATTVFVIGFRWIASKAKLCMFLIFALLLVAAFLFPEVKGASRWIRFGSFSIQPSEFAKLAVAFFVAKYCTDNCRTFSLLKSWNGILPLGGMIAMILAGILAGEDLGTSLLVMTAATLTLFAAGLYLRYLLVPLALLVVVAIYVIFFDATRWARVLSFMHPESMQSDEGYQLWTSLMALGSGGWFGVGFLGSRMKERYLPEAHTDFVISVIGEELGFLAIVVIIFAYVLWGFYALRISLRSSSRLGMLLGFAITITFTFQAAINLAVISGSVPTKGMPAPFVSYGGSNMIVSLTAVGVLLSIAADTVMPDYRQKIKNLFARSIGLKK